MPIKLQNIDAKLIINTVAGKYSSDDACLISIHDCLVTTAEQKDEVYEMMRGEIQKVLGFYPMFTSEPISEITKVIPIPEQLSYESA